MRVALPLLLVHVSVNITSDKTSSRFGMLVATYKVFQCAIVLFLFIIKLVRMLCYFIVYSRELLVRLAAYWTIVAPIWQFLLLLIDTVVFYIVCANVGCESRTG